MYTIHHRLIGKLVMDFLFVLIELFLLDVTSEALRANTGWQSSFLKRVGQFRPARTIFSRIDRPVNALQFCR